MTALPAIEDIIPAEELAECKEQVEKLALEGYQPILDSLIARFHPKATARVTADVSLSLVEEDGKPVLANSLTLGVVFTPEKTYDMLDEAQRTIVKKMFAHLLEK